MKRLALLLIVLCAVSPAAALAEGTAKETQPKSEEMASQPFKGGKGKVLDAIQTTGYTYVNVEMNGESVWAAAPRCEIKSGDTVQLPPGDLIEGFHSKIAERTFDRMYLVSCIELIEPEQKPPPKAHAK